MRKLLILTLIFGTLILSGCRDGMTGNTIKLTFPVQMCKWVDVPYQATEEYQEPFMHEDINTTFTTLNDPDTEIAVGEVNVRNVDSETGLFTVTQTFTRPGEEPQTKSTTRYIMSGESVAFQEEFDIVLGEEYNIAFTVESPTKTMTRTVTKTKLEKQCG